MRSQHPVGNGFWPAFWLMPEGKLLFFFAFIFADGTNGEMDIMEQVMNLPNNVYTTFHCNYTSVGAVGQPAINASYGTGYHTYGLQWLPNRLFWYVDGKLVFNITNGCVPDKPAYILANMAIGGSWPGPPTNMSLFPVSMDIDYIR
jgi:beta-glucanase (GH16 family)